RHSPADLAPLRRPGVARLERDLPQPEPLARIAVSGWRRTADLTAAPQNRPLRWSSPLKHSGCCVASRPGSIDRAGLSRRALELVWSRNQAVEPGQCAAVVLLGDAGE